VLPVETEWCHEDLAVDLPPWVAPLARAAGLRWQGLTFSYLVLRKEPRPLLASTAGHRVRFRVISDLLRTKGKAELFVCREDGRRERIRRLHRDEPDRDTAPGVRAFGELRRGDVVTLEGGPGGAPAIDERGRVAREAHATVWEVDSGAAGEQGSPGSRRS
jgi:hypothetical protein